MSRRLNPFHSGTETISVANSFDPSQSGFYTEERIIFVFDTTDNLCLDMLEDYRRFPIGIQNFEQLRKGDIESCLERTRSFFASILHDLENKTEKHYQTVFYPLFRLMGQYVDAEVKSAMGRADVVVRMKDAVYVFEYRA